MAQFDKQFSKTEMSDLRDQFNEFHGTKYTRIRDIRRFIKRTYDTPELTDADAYEWIYNSFAPTPKRVSFTETEYNFYTKRKYTYSNISNSNELYDSIMAEIALFPNARSAQVYFIPGAERGKVRIVSITRDILAQGAIDFNNFLEQVIIGNLAGSDRWLGETDVYNLDLDNFALSSLVVAGFGKSDKMIFQVVGIEGDKKLKDINGKKLNYNNCAEKCIKACSFAPKRDAKALSELDNLISEIKEQKLPINIIANTFTLDRNFANIIESSPHKHKRQIKDKKGNLRDHICAPLSLLTDVSPVYLLKTDGATNTIIFDDINKHFDLLTNDKIELCDDVFLTMSCNVIKNDSILFTPKQMNSNSKIVPKTPMKLKYVFFDYETIIDWNKSSCMREYSLSILVLDDKELEQLKVADENKDINLVNKIRQTNCITFLGYDCSVNFIKWIIKNQSNTEFVFIGFNNSNFDNFILLDALLTNQNNFVDDYTLHDIFYNGSQLLNFQMCGRHTTFDIRKHLMGSLKYNCNSFKINCCSKKEFDHNKAQLLHEEGLLIDWISDNEELKIYNEYDVLATAVLYAKYRDALRNVDATKKFADKLYNTKTIGSLIYSVFDAHTEEKGYEFKKLSYKHYSDLRKFKIAGRVEMFNGVQKVNERMASGDACSLYPYVMAVLNCFYPVGDTTETDEYQGDDVIGFYYCDIDQSNLKAADLPKIYALKTDIENDWGHEQILQDYLISNVMIRLLRKYGCKVTVKAGFYWENKVKSCEMFEFLLGFMSEKNHQDTLKKDGDSAYNPALRETLKLLMNSLSGKVIEGLHSEKTQAVESVEEYVKIQKKATKINTINDIGNKVFITYEIPEESVIGKQKPIYLGCLIYDHAKEYMYEYSYSKIGLSNLIYTDTDATKVRYTDFVKWNDWIKANNVQVPHWEEVELIDPRYKNHLIYEPNSKVFGSFEDELEEMVGENYVFYCLEKKSWCYSVDGKAKYRFKGINDNAQILTLKEDIIMSKQVKNELVYKIKPEIEQKVNQFYNSNKANSIGANNQVRFFEKIYKEGEAYVLCSSFRKIVKNSNREVAYAEKDRFNNLMNCVQVRYVVKKLSLQKKKSLSNI